MKRICFVFIAILLFFMIPVVHAESKYLYDVIKEEAESGGLAKEYIGEHQDTVDNSGNDKIYYYQSTSDEEADGILSKWNLLFGGFCWEMFRTTDSGGVKLLYNGFPSDGKCYGSSATIGSYRYSVYDNLSGLGSVGYMYNRLYNYENFSLVTGYFGNNVEYNNGIYTLKDAVLSSSIPSDYKHRYFCKNGSMSCTEVYYAHRTNEFYKLTGGRNIDDFVYEQLYADDVNLYDSDFKKGIDNWFQNNMLNYQKYLENTVFCQDRTFQGVSSFDPDGGIMYGTYFYHHLDNAGFSDEEYKNAVKLDTNLKCNNVTDRFSVSNEKAKLKYSVATINLAEALLLFPQNYDGYGMNGSKVRGYNSGNNGYWLLSPYNFPGVTYGWHVSNTGSMYYFYGSNTNSIRPSVSLKSGAKFLSGNGSKDSPYIFDNIYSSVNVEVVNGTKEFTIEMQDLTQVAYEEEVTFKVTPIKGYQLNSLKIVDEDNNEIDYSETGNKNEYTFIMPSSNVTIIPSYQKVKNSVEVEEKPHTKAIVIEVEDAKAVVYEDMVKFTITPEEGYELDFIEITDTLGNKIDYKKTNNKNEYEFIMPDTDVTITPFYREIKKDDIINPWTRNYTIPIILFMLMILVL